MKDPMGAPHAERACAIRSRGGDMDGRHAAEGYFDFFSSLDIVTVLIAGGLTA
jgi:hypothetical protein